MQLSGLVLDVYDDFSGGVLRELYPRFDDIPGKVKTAQSLSAEDREKLPDDVFALVLVNNGQAQRKYACIDEGNTLLSLHYFLKNAYKLPVEAQRSTAENLKVACSWYDLEVPEPLEKIALGAMSALMALPILKGTSSAIKDNQATQAAVQGGQKGMIVTPEMRAMAKQGEVSGTVLAPNQGPGDPGTAPKSKTTILKTALVGHLVTGGSHGKDIEPDVVHPPTKEQKPRSPQAREMHPTVDVSNKEPPRMIKQKEAEHFALPEQHKYPLDSYAQVKAASAYFDTYSRHMAPATRHEYAVNLVKRAEQLDLSVSREARKYGSEDFAPEIEIKAAFDARRIEVAHNTDALKLLGEVEKVARYRMWKSASADALTESYTPAQVVELLAEFDKVAGLDHHYDRGIPDPYYSVYGFEKDATADFTETIANDTVTGADLRRLARVGAFTVKTTFGADFQEEFLKDPIGIFKSLPLDQKKMLMRIASSTGPVQERTYI